MNAARPPFTLRLTRWAQDAAPLRRVREAVFIVEQRIPASLEWDEHDALSLHVLALSAAGEAVGCARLLPDAHIGRVAVLAHWRGQGIGAAMIAALVEAARARGDREVLLDAQVQALPFYRRLGFDAFGEMFDEAGIPHQAMRRALA